MRKRALGFAAVRVPLLDQVVTAPGDLVARIERALTSLEEIAAGVSAMHGEFVGMRKDIVSLDRRVQGLRKDVQSVNAHFDTLIGHVGPISPRIDELAVSLESVQALADRVAWMGRRRPKDGSAPAVEALPTDPAE